WKDVQCTVNKVTCHEVVEVRKCCVMVPVWTDVKKTITVCKMVPSQVEKEVCFTKCVPVCVTDPCTGCTKTVYQKQVYTQKVMTTVCAMVPEQKEIICKVCSYKPEERSYQCRRMVYEC